MIARRKPFILGLITLVLAVAAIGAWQFQRVGSSIRNMPVQDARDVALSAMTDIALDPDVLPRTTTTPALDQFEDNSEQIKRRAILVTTWLNATLLAKDVGSGSIADNEIVSSFTLTDVPTEHKADGWRNPYCVFRDADKIAVLSGGEGGPLHCKDIVQTAKRLAASPPTAQLHKSSDGILFTVQTR
jgi:hypothetical protein